jgi:HSP90 family molecular chaperone
VGNTLYNDRRVFLRELIQNAVDACNLRRMYETDYEPSIQLAFNQDISQITTRDNGIGMSKQWIEKYFLNIGLSFYQSDEIRRVNRDANIQFSFISQSGILGVSENQCPLFTDNGYLCKRNGRNINPWPGTPAVC